MPPKEEDIKLYDIVGKTGKHQFFLLLTVFSATAVTGMASVTLVLLAPDVNMYWDWEASNPNKTVFGSSECKMNEIVEHNRTSKVSNHSSKLIYESRYSKRTLTEELNLVCERSWLISLGNLCYSVGIAFSGIIVGRLTEIYGRKPCTLCITAAAVVSGTCIMFTKGYVMLALSLVIFGGSTVNLCSFIFIEVLEIIPTNWSQYVGTFAKSGLLLGQTVLVGVAWILEDWFYTQLFQTAFILLLFGALWFSLESAIWLAVRKRYKEAKENILKIADRNGREREEVNEKIDLFLEQIKDLAKKLWEVYEITFSKFKFLKGREIRCEIQSTAEKGKLSDLFKKKTVALCTIGFCVSRFANNTIYSALILNVETFGSGLYVDLTISNVMSFGSILLALLVMRSLSIRTQLWVCSLCGGIVCAIFPLVYGHSVARSAISILGRCFMAPPACIMLVYLTEVYPTSMRGVATGFVSTVGTLSGCLSPFTKELGEKTALYVPFILFAVLGFISAGIFKLLPETKGKQLIHTADEFSKRNRKEPTTASAPVYTISTKL